MASQLAAAVDAIVAELRSVGVKATSDARSLNPPGAYVAPGGVIGVNLCGEQIIRVDIYLVAEDRGGRIDTERIGQMLDKILPVIALDEPAVMVTVTPPGMPSPLPAMLIKSTVE